MKSLFWIILVLLVPISGIGQTRLYFHATIDLPMTGTTDDTTGGCSIGGEPITPISGDMEVTLNDTLPLIAGENRYSLKSPIANWGGQCVYSGNYKFQYDPESYTLSNLQITAAGNMILGPNDSTEINFAISLDSISLGVISESNWILAGGGLPCSYSSNYYTQYLMMTGALGWQKTSGQGQTILVSPTASSASVEVSTKVSSSSIQITSLGNGSIQIERDSNAPAEAVEIFDAVGRVTVRATIDGNVARISNLLPGLYFARIGDQMVKFIVSSR